jgi:hypothetical protein
MTVHLTISLFEIIVAVAIQSVFHLKIYQNKAFLFFKNYFWHQHIKTIWNYIKKIILNKFLFLKFEGTTHHVPKHH